MCSDQIISSISILLSSDDNMIQPMMISVPNYNGTDILNYNTGFTVDEDTNYTISVIYSICDGDYNVTGSTSIG